jgi:hypothetical protein
MGLLQCGEARFGHLHVLGAGRARDAAPLYALPAARAAAARPVPTAPCSANT